MAPSIAGLGLDLGSEPGVYALGLELLRATTCTIGALGEHALPAGLYLYVGSAWGPGGLRARVERHLSPTATRHWHIDYVRPHTQPRAVWLASERRLECAWAQHLLADPRARSIIPRFGASDCACVTHLTYWGAVRPPAIQLPASDFIDIAEIHNGRELCRG